MAELPVSGAQAPRKSGGNCCLFGCLGVIVVVLVAAVGGYLGVTKVLIPRLLDQYTTTTAITLPAVEISQEDLTALQTRWKEFAGNLDAGQPVQIELSADEVNALIQHSPDWEGLKDVIYVQLEPGVVRGQMCIDLGSIWKLAKGRFFTGEAAFAVSIADGQLDIRAQELKVSDKPIDQASDMVSGVNLADEIYSDSDNEETVERLRRVNRLEIEADRLIIEANQ